MQAAVMTEAGKIEIQDRPDPAPGWGQVLVRIHSVGVCGSDRHLFTYGGIGDLSIDAPLILGHEAAGKVEAVGEGCTRLSVGDRVSLEPGIPDRSCRACSSGRYNLCPSMRFLGTPAIGEIPAVDGAYAEYVAHDEMFAHPVPDEISDDAAALLEPLSVALWAGHLGEVGPDSQVLITGAGTIGLMAVIGARAYGATDITVAARNRHRLDVAGLLGAVTVNTADRQLPAHTNADVLIECTGVPSVARRALDALAPGGRAVLAGVSGDDLPVNLLDVHIKELTIHGVFRYVDTWPAAIALAASRDYDLNQLVSGHYSLQDAHQALAARDVEPASIKAIIKP